MSEEELLKELTIRVQSYSPVALNQVTDEEVAVILSDGKASLKSTAVNCPAYSRRALGAGLTLS